MFKCIECGRSFLLPSKLYRGKYCDDCYPRIRMREVREEALKASQQRREELRKWQLKPLY